MLKTISTIFTTIGVFISSLLGGHAPSNIGAYNPTGGGTYRLQSSVTSSATSFTLASFKEPISNIPYTMTYLNSSIEYGTFEPQSGTKEFVSFSGITQNVDGTATITGAVRGLGFSYPYTASTTLTNPHPGQSIFILSNPPQLTNQYLNLLNSSQTVAGTNTFGATTTFSVSPSLTVDCTSGSANTDICAKAYIDAVAVAGASNANDTTKGIVETATALEAAAGTSLGGTGARLALGANLSTSTSQVAQNSVVVTKTTGKIDPSFLNGTSENYNFLATTTLATTTLTGRFGIGTTSPYAPLSVVGSGGVVADNLNATNTAATSTFAGGLNVTNTASTTNLVISSKCTGCTNFNVAGYVAAAGPTSAGNTATVTTGSCTVSGQKQVSATASTTSTASAGVLLQSIVYNQAAANWYAQYFCGTGGCAANTISIAAICINP